MSEFVKFAGQFHPAVIHLPVAMLMAAAGAEMLHWWKPVRLLENVAAFNLHLGAVSGVVAAVLGWCLAATEGVTPDLKGTLLWHRWLGIGTAVLAIILVALWHRHRARPSQGILSLYRAGLIAGAALVGLTGHLGGTLVYGLDWYQWAAK